MIVNKFMYIGVNKFLNINIVIKNNPEAFKIGGNIVVKIYESLILFSPRKTEVFNTINELNGSANAVIFNGPVKTVFLKIWTAINELKKNKIHDTTIDNGKINIIVFLYIIMTDLLSVIPACCETNRTMDVCVPAWAIMEKMTKTTIVIVYIPNISAP